VAVQLGGGRDACQHSSLRDSAQGQRSTRAGDRIPGFDTACGLPFGRLRPLLNRRVLQRLPGVLFSVPGGCRALCQEIASATRMV
jgi:hypothetical protein